VGEFSASWLALREPADVAARASRVTESVGRWLAAAAPSAGGRLAVDLGSGTGSNFRYLSPRLPMVRHWRLVDHDRALLDKAQSDIAGWGVARALPVRRDHADLLLGAAPDLTRVELVDGDLAAEPTWLRGNIALVTASALLDLVSTPWMHALVRRVVEARACALFALSYDGRIVFDPDDVADERVRELVNRHQRTDKGFRGAALGPDAASLMRDLLTAAGYQVITDKSDWELDSSRAALQSELVRGWSAAATEVAPAARHDIAQWERRRLAESSAGRLKVIVGHDDLAARPSPQ
jgi:hypothetical protein